MTMARVNAAPKSTTVVYRGDVEALIGRKFVVPLGVSNMRQWIEDNHTPAPAPEPKVASIAEPVVASEPLAPKRRPLDPDLAEAVRISGAAIVGAAERCDAKIHEWDSRNEATVQQFEATAQAAQEQTQTAVEITEQSKAELQQALSEERNLTQQLRTELDAYVRSDACKGDKGERGKRGVPGSGVGYCNVNPSEVDSESLGERFFGRAVVPGDVLLRRTKDALLVYRSADGVTWRQVDQIVNAQELVSQRLAVSDHSSHTMVSMPAAPSKGEGGSADNMKTVMQVQGGINRLASLDRYAAIGYSGIAKSALISVEATILDGPHVGQTGTWLISAALNSLGSCDVAIYAELGEIVTNFGVAPSIEIRTTTGFTKPTSVTGVYPTAGSIECFCNGWLEPTTGWAGRPTQMALKGWIKWNTDDRILGVAPAWTLQQEYA